MSDRQRTLPSWMERKTEKVKEKESLKNTKRRRAARSVFYCMNEKELVEAAVSYLTSGACQDVALLTDQQVEYKEIETNMKMKKKLSKSEMMPQALVESSSDSDVQDRTCVSETDLDVTEAQTVSYTSKPEGQRSRPAQHHSSALNAGLEADKREELSQMPADAAEEDAFRLVREIFFT